MKNLIQEACQGPVRDAVRAHGAAVGALTEDALRPVVLRDFQARTAGGWVGCAGGGLLAAGSLHTAGASPPTPAHLNRPPPPNPSPSRGRWRRARSAAAWSPGRLRGTRNTMRGTARG